MRNTEIIFVCVGGGVGGCHLYIAKVLKLAVNRRSIFWNALWPDNCERYKPWKRFCKTSLNAREQLFSKSVDKKSVWPDET